jgi:MFS family permease
MICTSSLPQPASETTDEQPSSNDDGCSGPSRPYGTSFWFAYLACITVSTGIALLYRYADFVTVLGGTELHLGWIVGLGMTGSLLTRLAVGTAIDRQGPRRIWLLSCVVFAASSLAHLGVQHYDGPTIYILRVVWCCSVAGIFGASTTFVALGAPLLRVAELVGMLGTSGFLGMVLGTNLGDLLYAGTHIPTRTLTNRMFLVAALLAMVSMVFVWLATRNEVRPVRRRHVSTWGVLRRYHPGAVLVVGIASGIGLGIPQTFLRTYAAELGLARIGLFFGVYAPAAVITRIVTRRWTARYGLERIILGGTAGLVGSVLLFLTVRHTWQLVIPGLGYGIAHALLYPATVAAGSRTFPQRHRGLATTLILATWDAGLLLGSPVAGVVLHFSERVGLPAYPTMFVCMALLMSVMASVYIWPAFTAPRPLARPAPARVNSHSHPRAVHVHHVPDAEPVAVANSDTVA